MLKFAFAALALLFAFAPAPAFASPDTLSGVCCVKSDLDVSSARRKKKSVKRSKRHSTGVRHRRPAPAQQSAGRSGEDVCRGDAIRLCKPVLGQGNMAVLGCFKARANRLSRGCRALLRSYGQL